MEEVSEAEIMAACSAGQILECADGSTHRPVQAALLRRCCDELSDQVHRHGLRLRNAAIAGSLDLSGLEVRFPLIFADCEFESPLIVEGAQLFELGVNGCTRLPGLLANGVRIRRDLDLSRTFVAGALRTSASTSKQAAIWLCESEIGGRLLCVDTVIPLISLDQRSTWHPDAQAPDGTFMQWWLNAAAILGWLLSSIFVLSLARLARSV